MMDTKIYSALQACSADSDALHVEYIKDVI